MSKIVRAVNTMLARPEGIAQVVEKNDEMYFVYAAKHVWAVGTESNYVDEDPREEFYLRYYPKSRTLKDALDSLISSPFVKYSTDVLGTREARESFIGLYTVVKEKLYGADGGLDAIIADGDL